MIIKLNKKILFILFFIIISISHGNESKFNKIEVLVNENIITNYDIVQRMKIYAIINRIEINSENYELIMNSVVEDLVIEKLKNSKINEYNISFNEDEFKNHEERFYASINIDQEEIKKIFTLNDINYDYLLNFIEIELKWQKLIFGLYLRVTSVTEQEINELISKNPNINEEIANDIALQKQLDIKSTKLLKDLRDEATIEYK